MKKIRNKKQDVTLLAITCHSAVPAQPLPSVKSKLEDTEEDKAGDIWWEWLDDSLKPKLYDKKVNSLIEKGYNAVPRVPITVEIRGTKYRVDYTSMTQTNLVTNGPRVIQRRYKSESEKADKPTPLPVPSKRGHKETEEEPTAESGAKSLKLTTISGGTTKVVKKGHGVVDVHSGKAASAHVYEEGKDVYQCTLNQTNIGTNNNKFYIIQLLEDDKESNKYWVWTRWARVGQIGQSCLDAHTSLTGAKECFMKKFRDKTQKSWESTEHFVKVAGKYQLMEMDYGEEDDTKGGGGAVTSGPVPDSKLSPAVQHLMKKISNKLDMEKAMKELEIDTRKMPLGKVSKKQIKDAFSHLKNIEHELGKPKPNNSVIVDSTSMFYTLIPHDFGMSAPPVIRDPLLLKKKMELLDTLADLEIASKLLEESKSSGKNPLDAAYDSMRCKITPLAHSSETYKLISQYLQNTHGKTHTAYKLVLLDAFEVDREGEKTAYTSSYSGLHNKKMLCGTAVVPQILWASCLKGFVLHRRKPL